MTDPDAQRKSLRATQVAASPPGFTAFPRTGLEGLTAATGKSGADDGEFADLSRRREDRPKDFVRLIDTKELKATEKSQNGIEETLKQAGTDLGKLQDRFGGSETPHTAAR